MALTSKTNVQLGAIVVGFVAVFGPAAVDTGLSAQQTFWVAFGGAVLATAGVLLRSMLAAGDDTEQPQLIAGSVVRTVGATVITAIFFLYIITRLYTVPF